VPAESYAQVQQQLSVTGIFLEGVQQRGQLVLGPAPN
jgi:hypothetical protein